MTDDMTDLPVVPIPGSEGWAEAYHWGEALADRFPGQDANDLAYACEYNDWGPLRGENARPIKDLKLIQQGENDGADWVWIVTFDHDFSGDEVWALAGGCDFTGWDCQSSAVWTKLTGY